MRPTRRVLAVLGVLGLAGGIGLLVARDRGGRTGGAPVRRGGDPAPAVSGTGPYPITAEFPSAEDGRLLDLVPEFRWSAEGRRVDVEVDVPDGWVRWSWSGWYLPECRGIESLRVVCPLRREATFRVSVVGPPGASWERVSWRVRAESGPRFDAGVSTSEGGDFQVRGVPHVPGLRVVLVAEATGGEERWVGWETLVLGRDLEPDRPITVRVEEGVEPPKEEGLIGIGGGAGGAFPARVRRPLGSLRILLERRGRAHVDGVQVRIPNVGLAGVTDEAGRAYLPRVPAGEVQVEVRQIGVVPFAVPAVVEPDRETFVALREPVGARLAVRVVDAAGRPLPYALVWVEQPSGVEWVDLDGQGILRLDKFTDVEGRREFERLEAGKVTVRSSLGSLAGEATVEAFDGRRADVEVVLR